MDKVTRMAGLVGCNEDTLRIVAKVYFDSRLAGKSPKASHIEATDVASRMLGMAMGAWDYATWAQNLVDTQMVTFQGGAREGRRETAQPVDEGPEVTMKPSEVLKAARAKIAQGWTQGTSARDTKGDVVDAWQREAVRWCAAGAIDTATRDWKNEVGPGSTLIRRDSDFQRRSWSHSG